MNTHLVISTGWIARIGAKEVCAIKCLNESGKLIAKLYEPSTIPAMEAKGLDPCNDDHIVKYVNELTDNNFTTWSHDSAPQKDFYI